MPSAELRFAHIHTIGYSATHANVIIKYKFMCPYHSHQIGHLKMPYTLQLILTFTALLMPQITNPTNRIKYHTFRTNIKIFI
jgi:hypothetical protein